MNINKNNMVHQCENCKNHFSHSSETPYWECPYCLNKTKIKLKKGDVIIQKEIDFSKHPKILPYVKDLIDKPYFKRNMYNNLTEEAFIEIVEGWIDEYENNIDVIVKNTLLVYDLTNGETGYQSLSKDWAKWKPFLKDKMPKFPEDMVIDQWRRNFIYCIANLYQGYKNNSGEISAGAAGLMSTCSFTVRFTKDKITDKPIAVSDFNMSIDIRNSLHSEVDNK